MAGVSSVIELSQNQIRENVELDLVAFHLYLCFGSQHLRFSSATTTPNHRYSFLACELAAAFLLFCAHQTLQPRGSCTQPRLV